MINLTNWTWTPSNFLIKYTCVQFGFWFIVDENWYNAFVKQLQKKFDARNNVSIDKVGLTAYH